MKTIFFRLLLILFILLAIILLYQPTKEKDSLYKGKENEDVYVSVKVGDNTQKILLDDYLLGVVAGEMPASFELEAIKAQVVASRTFVYSRLLSVDNTTNTQVYLDDEKMKVSWSDHYEEYKEKVQKAIVETKGEILTYQGKCISALFYSSSNGKSENVENYFKGSSQPYLVSVDSHWDQEYDPQFIKKVKYTKAQLNSFFGGSFQYRFLERYPSGRVKSILINQKQYSGREVREKLQLSSSDFEIVKEGNSYIFVTKGCGHGVGLSQYGAQGMAKEGYNYQVILKHYYQGVEISKNKE